MNQKELLKALDTIRIHRRAGESFPILPVDKEISLVLDVTRRSEALDTLGFTFGYGDSLAINDQGILLVGDTGVGKTTVMESMCRQFHGREMGERLFTLVANGESGFLVTDNHLYSGKAAIILDRYSRYVASSDKYPLTYIFELDTNPDQTVGFEKRSREAIDGYLFTIDAGTSANAARFRNVEFVRYNTPDDPHKNFDAIAQNLYALMKRK